MNMHFTKFLTLAAALSPLVSSAQKKPNILFIFGDDHAYNTIHAHGNERIETPNLDKLSKSGTHFTHAYNSGAWNGAVCVASRTMMITGKQLWNAKAAKLNDLNNQKKLTPQVIQAAGYDTYFAGKWHVSTTPETVFQHVKNPRKGMPNQRPERYKRKFIKGEKDSWDPTDTSNGGFWKGGKHWSEVLVDDAQVYFDAVAKSDKPFFMYLCFSAPHDPRQAPQEFQDKYPYDTIKVPESFQPLYPFDIGSNRIRDEKLAPFPRTPYSIQVNRSEYYALITHMDVQIGRILEALEATGKADNTIVIYAADHGLACGNHGLLGKQNMYEHSLRVPWIISAPKLGFPEGKKIDYPIYIQDAIATCIDLTGAKKPASLEFNSVLPLLKNAAPAKSRDMYGSYLDVQRMVIHNDHKLIFYPKIPKVRLYNLKNDPLELKDISQEPASKAIIQECQKALLEQMKLMGDPMADALKKVATVQ